MLVIGFGVVVVAVVPAVIVVVVIVVLPVVAVVPAVVIAVVVVVPPVGVVVVVVPPVGVVCHAVLVGEGLAVASLQPPGPPGLSSPSIAGCPPRSLAAVTQHN